VCLWVQVSRREAEAISEELGVTAEQFTARYVEVLRGTKRSAHQCRLRGARGPGHRKADHTVSAAQDGTFADQVYRPLRKNAAGDACVLLDGRHCSVYNSRPAQVAAALGSSGSLDQQQPGAALVNVSPRVQCRTYPFWPEHVQSAHDWEAEAARCEGITAASAAGCAMQAGAPWGGSTGPWQVTALGASREMSCTD